MTIIKTLKHKCWLSLGTCQRYVAQYADPTPTIFWYAKRAKSPFLNMSVLHVRVSGCIANVMHDL